MLLLWVYLWHVPTLTSPEEGLCTQSSWKKVWPIILKLRLVELFVYKLARLAELYSSVIIACMEAKTMLLTVKILSRPITLFSNFIFMACFNGQKMNGTNFYSFIGSFIIILKVKIFELLSDIEVIFIAFLEACQLYNAALHALSLHIL